MLQLQLNMATEMSKLVDFRCLHNANQWPLGYLEVTVVDSSTSQ